MANLSARDNLKIILYDQIIGLLTTDKKFRDRFISSCESGNAKSGGDFDVSGAVADAQEDLSKPFSYFSLALLKANIVAYCQCLSQNITAKFKKPTIFLPQLDQKQSKILSIIMAITFSFLILTYGIGHQICFPNRAWCKVIALCTEDDNGLARRAKNNIVCPLYYGMNDQLNDAMKYINGIKIAVFG